MIMKRIFLTILLITLGMPLLYADVTLPKQCEAFLPKELRKALLMEEETNQLANSSDYGQNESINASDKSFWDVYSDRTNNVTYTSPRKSSEEYGKLDFAQKLRIAKIEDGFALVYEEPKTGTSYPLISSEAVSKGWVPMSKLLLWSSCPADRYGIYNKALLALDFEEYRDKQRSGSSTTIGNKYLSPESMVADDKIRTEMSFYFIMKRENNMVLLANQYKLDGLTGANRIYGWVRSTDYVQWNQRSCIEANWRVESVNKFKQNSTSAKIYAEKEMSTSVSSWSFGKEFVDHPENKFRTPASVLRYPILNNENDSKDLYRCTTFGTIQGELSTIAERVNNAITVQKETVEKMKQLNLIVVIDGTRSMEKYFPAVKSAISQACNDYLTTDYYNPKVGLVIYRDYADGDLGLCEYVPMSAPDDMRLNSFFDKGGDYGIKSAAADRTNEEALFKGLELALDSEKMGYNKDESNVLLVIGDCGNDDRDENCLTQEEIVKRMVENNINLLAFQIRRNNEHAWLSFTNQMLQVVSQNVNSQYASLGDYKATFNRLEDGYDLTNNNGDFYVGSIRYTDTGQDMETDALIELLAEKIKIFESAVRTRIDALERGGYDMGISADEADASAKMANDYFEKALGEENAAMLRETRSLIAFEGYTPKVSEYGDELWTPIMFISREEFEQLMEHFARVDESARSLERKPYVDAVKMLAEKLAGKSAEESGKMTNAEIMNLIAGLNETSRSLAGPTMDDLLDPEAVSELDFKKLIAEFQRKYRGLTRILHATDDPFIWNDKGVNYYWIPISNLP